MMSVDPRPVSSGPGVTYAAPDAREQPAQAAPSAPATAPQTALATLPPGPAMPATHSVPRDPAEMMRAAPPPRERVGEADEFPPEPPRPAPAGPLMTYAEIPSEVMKKIAELREELAGEKARGIPGRPDPTPMPADSAAIGAPRRQDGAA
jgi:hypothetical protein